MRIPRGLPNLEGVCRAQAPGSSHITARAFWLQASPSSSIVSFTRCPDIYSPNSPWRAHENIEHSTGKASCRAGRPSNFNAGPTRAALVHASIGVAPRCLEYRRREKLLRGSRSCRRGRGAASARYVPSDVGFVFWLVVVFFVTIGLS